MELTAKDTQDLINAVKIELENRAIQLAAQTGAQPGEELLLVLSSLPPEKLNYAKFLNKRP